jgi:predicted ATPase/DNA-binding XRE family transcriptional regulator
MAHHPQTTFGSLLQQYRRAARLTQEALAERAGYSPNYLSMLERGVRVPGLATVDLLAEALKLAPGDRAALEAAAQPARAEPEAGTADLGAPDLIGREQEASSIGALLRRSGVQLLTLTGPGGVGKTRLAQSAAQALRDGFPDGIIFLDLAVISDAGQVPAALMQSLQLRERSDRPPRDSLLEHLRGKRALLVADSFEHVLDAAPLIRDLLDACPQLKVLVTSRAPLRLRGEQEYPVQPLACPPVEAAEAAHLLEFPAVALFIQRARLVLPDFPTDEPSLLTIAEISRRLEGLPLAIELAAARVKHMPLGALRDRLEHRLEILTGGARDLPARQRRMLDTIAWSYDLLQPAQQSLFRQLACFVGTWGIEAAEAVCRIPDAQVDVLEALSLLVDNSLVLLDGGRYRMLDTIGEFAAQQLLASGEADEVGRRHAEYYVRFAERAGPAVLAQEQGKWYDRLELEHGNLRRAFYWLLDHEGAEAAARLATSIWRFWVLHGDFVEGGRWLDEAISRRTAIPARLLATALWGAYWLAYHRGDYTASANFSAQALDVSRKTGDPLDRRNALTGLGLAALAQERYTEALPPLRESVELCRGVGRNWSLATSLLNLSFAAMHVGEHALTASLLAEALAIYRELGDQAFEARTHSTMGYAALLEGRLAEAEAAFRQTLGEFAELGEQMGTAEALEGLAAVYAETERAKLAALLTGASSAIRTRIATQPLPFHRAAIAPGLNMARKLLGEEQWQAACLHGRGLSAEETLALALG